jgi:Fic family protein
MSGSVTIEWQGRKIQAACPDPIGQLAPTLSERTIRSTERAAAAVQQAGDRAAGLLETTARLLLRAEGLASSAIEGIRAPAGQVALAEVACGSLENGSSAGWVADNLAVVTAALADPGPLDEARLLAWHEQLMANSPAIAARHVGAYRDVLGWVGGPNPLVAAHVAVPAPDIRRLMDDLFMFVGRQDLDPVTQAGIAHAQFETIHPFADGNGRLGRVLIGRILSQRLAVPVPPPVSLSFARDLGGYQSGLTLYRQGHLDEWVSWFANSVETAAAMSGRLLNMVVELQAGWRAATSDLRADSAARRLVEILPGHPVVSAQMASRLLGVSEQSARSALEVLLSRGVLTEMGELPHTRGRPRRWWEASTLLALLGR